MKGQQVYELRAAGYTPRFGWVALFILAVMSIHCIYSYYSKAQVKETFVERTYKVENDKVVETEVKRESEYRIDPEKLTAGITLEMSKMVTEALDEAENETSTKNSQEKNNAKKEAKLIKHFPESTYIKGAIMLYGEAGGVDSIVERSGCLWIACNRVLSDNPFFPNDLESVIEQESQFDGYTIDGTYTKADYDLAVDVFERFYREQNGEPSDEVGRTIPVDYLFFIGDGEHNYFSKTQNGTPYVWGSMFVSPYKN